MRLRRPRHLLFEGVLDLFAGILEVGLRLVAVALIFSCYFAGIDPGAEASARWVPRQPVSNSQKSFTGAWLEALAGQLADPTDPEFEEDHLDDPDALAAAVDDLLACKPQCARRPTGEIGQGASPPAASSVDLAALLRQRAR